MSFVKFYHPGIAHTCHPANRCATKFNKFNPESKAISSMPYNIIKQENGWTLEIQIVGYVKDELTISVENNLLKIASIEASVDNSTDKNYLRKEFRKLPFENRFKIPAETDIENISANVHQGILSIELPLLPKSTKSITIQ